MPNNSQQIKRILGILKNTYPNAKIVLNYRNNWELLVAVILSAQCTDVKVNQVTAKLFKKYPSIADYANADIKELEQDIKSTGFYHHKAKNIQNSAKIILEKYQGKIPDTMTKILALPGVARKTANVVLGNAYHKIEGIAVDTHVLRISQRLRLVDLNKIGLNKKPVYYNRVPLDYYKDANPEKIEQELMKVIPHKDWFKFTYQIIDHGRAICQAQNPRCNICSLNNICPSSRT